MSRTSSGYARVRVPGHPRAEAGGRVIEHILIAERALGRPLDVRHEVHHVDEDKTNNAPSNLVICENAAYHKLLHRRQRALDACGDANARLCHICHQYDRQDDIIISTSDRRGYERTYHRSCCRERALIDYYRLKNRRSA